MGISPAPFSDIGKKAKDLLTKDYNFNQKFTLSVVGSTGLGLTANGLKKEQVFVGDINTLYKSGNTTVNVKVDTYSNVSTKVTQTDVLPNTKIACSFKISDHNSGKGLTANGLKKEQVFVGGINTLYKSGNTTVNVKVDTYSNVSTKVTQTDVLPNTKIACSFKIPDHKSGKLDVQYLHPHAAIDCSIGLNPAPLLELSATIGNKDLSLGGGVGFDTASSLLTKYNAGVSYNKPDFSAALLLTDKGQTLKATYVHAVHSANGTTVAAELTHRLSTLEKSFTLGSAHAIDPHTVVKTRFSDSGKAALLWQREWRPKSLITFSGEYDSKVSGVAPKFGLSLALKP